MGKITVKNKSAAVQVLKCLGLPPLRLFPGYNQVDEKQFAKYIKGSKAAKGMCDEHLRPVESPSADQTKEAKKAAAKNAELNKAKKVIQKTNDALVKSEDKVSVQAATIKEQGDLIKDLTERLAALEKDAKPGDDPDPKKKDK